MSSSISKEDLEHLADLARIKLDPGEEDGLVKDLQSILAYFNELQKLNTDGVEPVNGGTLLSSVFREDEQKEDPDRGAGVDVFPEHKDGYLVVPPIFEE